MKVLVLFDLERPPKAGENFTPQVLEHEEERFMEADVIRAIKRLGHEVQVLPVFENVKAIVDRFYEWSPEVVFNMVESFYGYRAQEPNVPALLELLNVHYTGSGPVALQLCKDKSMAKKVLSYHRVPIAHFVTSHRKRPLRRLRRFKFPAFVKPVGEESSDGIAKASFAKTEEEAIARARFIHDTFQTDALIEEYIEGREIYISILGNYKLTIFPPRELFFGKIPEDVPKFATAKAKWDDDYRKKWEIDNRPVAELPEGALEKLRHIARRVYRLLQLRGFARLDVRLTPAGQVVVLEANPNPSLALSEDFAQSAASGGIAYDELIRKILALA